MDLSFELLAPRGLWLLGLLVPLVALYILKVRRSRWRVSSTWLWQEARRDIMARSPFKRLIVQIPLVLQALALVALALALAEPASRGRVLGGDHIALVIDTSASMSAVERASGKSRIELARQAALDLVSTLPPGADAMVLEAGRDARVVLPPDRDARRLRAAIKRIAARDVEGDLGAAIALGTSRLGQAGGRRRVVVVTDGSLARPAPLSGAAVPVEVVRVGGELANTAIVRLDVRAGQDPASRAEQVQAFLLVGNFGPRPRELYVTMRLAGTSDVLASRRVLVAAGERRPVVLTFNPAPGDYGQGLQFDVSPHDDMPVDDVAYGRVPAGRRLPVVLAAAGEPSPWLLRALVSDEQAEVRAGSVEELLGAPRALHDAFVVVQGACPAAVPGGDLLVVNPPPGQCFGAVVGAVIESPLLTSWDATDARLRFVSLDGVFLSQARRIEPESRAQALIRSSAGAIAADISTSARAATLLGFDVGESNWPLKASFVLFVRNLLEQARAHRTSGPGGAALAGEPLRASVPPAVREVQLEAPGGERELVPAHGGLAVVPDPWRAGLYRLSWTGQNGGTFVVPVNLVSEAESDLARKPASEAGPGFDVAAQARAPVAHRGRGWLLALLALGLVVLDVWYLTRRAAPVRVGIPLRPRLPERRMG
ncbi:MAG: VWA domain-containing protein [Deltaproteobacteria bacterium]|nr:VWA domain-containing protein [Deltaproteobacteria bacterium]